MALAYVGITLKWWKTIDDSPLAPLSGGNLGCLQADDADEEPTAGGDDADQSRGGDGAIVIEGDAGRSVVRSSMVVEKRASAGKSLKLATTILAKLPTMSLCDFACGIAQPIEQELFRTNASLKTAAGTLAWYIDIGDRPEVASFDPNPVLDGQQGLACSDLDGPSARCLSAST